MIKHDGAFRVLGEEHVYFYLVGRVCGVTKLLEITFYPTVIIKRDWEREKEMERERERERERESIERKEKEFISTFDPIWHETQHEWF